MLYVWAGRRDMRCRLQVICMARGAVCLRHSFGRPDGWLKRLYTCRRANNRHIFVSTMTPIHALFDRLLHYIHDTILPVIYVTCYLQYATVSAS